MRSQQTVRLESVTAQQAHKLGPGAVDQPVLVELDPVGEFLAARGALDDLHNPGFFLVHFDKKKTPPVFTKIP